MKIRDVVAVIDGEFNMVINNIKLINNRIEPIPEKLLDLEVKKIDFSDLIDIYADDIIN